MDEGLDSGPIIMKEDFQLNNDTYISEVYDWLYNKIPYGFIKSVKMLTEGCSLKAQKGNVCSISKKARGFKT